MAMETEAGVLRLLALDEEGGHEPRTVSSL